MGGLGGMGGMGNMQQMLDNPEFIEQAMNNPLVQSLMNDPEIMQEMMMQNPQMRQIMENNPELGQLLRDPEMIRRSMEMARNPNLMREMMRNNDRAMNNIEAIPGGFDALRRMYTDIQRPMESAMEESMRPPEDTSSTSSTN